MTVLTDIRSAVLAAFTGKVTITFNGPSVPLGQTAFNPGETLPYSVFVDNAADGGKLTNVRLHLSVDQQLRLIVPPAATMTAFQAATGTAAFPPGSEQTQMYLSSPALSVLVPGFQTLFGPLTIKAVALGTPTITAHIHGDLDMGWLFPSHGVRGAGSKSFHIVT